MKNYIIYLSQYPMSRDMAQKALESAQQQGWDAELYEGVDGATVSYQDFERQHKLTACAWNKKCVTMIREKPGVRGCFLSHWNLWNLCRNENKEIGIFEHDVEFLQAPKLDQNFKHVLKLEGFHLNPARPAGAWYEGARAYVLKPPGADRLIRWVQTNGCLPADVNIGLDVVDITLHDRGLVRLQFDHNSKIDKHSRSFTWNLETMPKINDRC